MSASPGAVPVLPARRLSWVVALVCGLALAALAAWLVPWRWLPAGESLPVVRAEDVFPADYLRRAQAYGDLQRALGWGSLAVSTVVSLVLGLTPLGARLVGRIRGPWWVRAALATVALLLLGRLATLPLTLWARSNALEAGLTRQSLAGWARDWAVGLLVAWVFAAVVVLLVVGLARRSPRRWPAYAAVAGVLLTFAGSWVYPVLVEPLFNRFTSLPEGSLRTAVLALADREGVPVSDVLVADASRRTTTLNAYVSGIGSTRRVVLYDNLVDSVPQEETLAVVAHELGHARDDDVLHGTVLAAAGVGLGFGVLGLVLSVTALRRRAGVGAVGSPEVVPLLLALVAVGTLVASPVQNTMSRAVEARADRTALAATGDRAAFERMQLQLAQRALRGPEPPAWSQLWFGTHPTVLQRLGLAEALDPGR